LWDSGERNEEDGFGARFHTVADSLGESTELVCEGAVPYVGGRAFDEVAVFKGGAGDGVDDDVE